MRSGSTGQHLLGGLDSGDLDLALGPALAGLPGRYAIKQLFSEELVIITSPGHRLGHQAALPLDELRHEPFVCFPPGSGLRKILNDTAASAGFTPAVPFETTSVSRIRELVSVGLGVALLARSVATASGRPVTVHSIRPRPLYRAIGLIHHRNHHQTPAALACQKLLSSWRTYAGDTQQT